MAHKGVLNTSYRQKVVLSLLINKEMNGYQMAKEWGELQQQFRFRENCKFLKGKRLLKEVNKEGFYCLNYRTLAKHLLAKLVEMHKSMGYKYDDEPEFTKKDVDNLANFSETELFKFFIESKFLENRRTDRTWNFRKGERFMVTIPFEQFCLRPNPTKWKSLNITLY